MKRKAAIYLAVILLAVLFLSTEALSNAEEEFHQTYRVKVNTEVEVKNINGDVHISGWDEDYVDVRALKRTKRDQSELDKVTIEVRIDDVMKIETVHKKHSQDDDDTFFKRVFGNMGLSSPKVTVEYTIRIPQSVILGRVETLNGNVKLNDTRGDTIIHSVNGNIIAEKTNGLIEAKTTNGDINITGDAGVREARTTNGSIKVSIPDDGDDNIRISSTNGSIDVYLSPDIDAGLDLKTTNGRISARDFRITMDTVSSRRFVGTLGSGGKTISVRTTNGSINLFEK